MSTTSTYAVEGMTCDHCVRAVTQEIGRLSGVRDVQIGLVPGGTSTVTVTSEAPIEPTTLAEAVDEAGYAISALLR